MARVLLLVLLAVGASAAMRPHHDALVQAGVTPVQKVVQMLTDMMAKGKKEKEDEQVSFATFQQFCKSTTTEKTQAIATTMSEIDDLNGDIAKAGETVMVMTKEIAQHDADIAAWTKEKEEAKHERGVEHDDFVKEHADYSASIDAVERAVESIKAGNKDVALVQQKAVLNTLVSLSKVPEASKRVIAAFLQGNHLETDLMEMEGPGDAKKFESSSGGVIEMVEQMGEKMEDKRDEIEKEEMNKKHAFDMIAQDLTDQIETNTNTREKKASEKAAAAEAKAQAEGDLASAQQLLAEDKKFVSELNSDCEAKSAEYEKNQEVRQGEIDAINKAIEIMSSGAIAGGTQHLPSASASLAQLRSSVQSSAQKSVAEFLKGRASKTQSRLLSLLAVRVADDPFGKVTKMIKDMITKLMEEATEEAEHKGFCDTELTTNKQTRDAKSEEAEELTAESEKLTADIALLSEEITTLGEQIAAIDAMMAKATAMREDEKAKNKATIDDSKVAQAATQQAMAVLKEFYDKMGSAAAMTQQAAGPSGPINYDSRAIQILDSASLLQ